MSQQYTPGEGPGRSGSSGGLDAINKVPPDAGPESIAAPEAAVAPPSGGRRGTLSLRQRVALAYRRLSPPQLLLVGYLGYAVLGTMLLCLPWAQAVEVRFIDNLFNAVSAMSTTGLVTVPTGDSYTFFGELVHLLLFQLGGIGYMTLTSFVVMATGRSLHRSRRGVLSAGFTLPHYFRLDHFVRQVVVFTLAIEAAGATVLYFAFRAEGTPDPLWNAVFHSVSAFATAGFGLHASNLEPFRDNTLVNVTIGLLCYAGAIGFIVMQDVYYSLRYRERMITFTSKVILSMTGVLFVGGTALLFLAEPTIRDLGAFDRLRAAAFQVMSASTTAGFNTVPVGALSYATLWAITILMLVGASPSGTGGGIKTTGVSSLLAAVLSIVRGREDVRLLGHEIPPRRVLASAATATLYFLALGAGLLALLLTEDPARLPSGPGVPDPFVALLFEAASALCTVGLSTGVTPALSDSGKLVIVVLMFIGRLGLVTLGLALLHRRHRQADPAAAPEDLAT